MVAMVGVPNKGAFKAVMGRFLPVRFRGASRSKRAGWLHPKVPAADVLGYRPKDSLPAVRYFRRRRSPPASCQGDAPLKLFLAKFPPHLSANPLAEEGVAVKVARDTAGTS